jgi:plastocyanin
MWGAMVCAAAMQAAGADQPAAVEIKNYHFVPETLKIPAGTTVTWTNKDDDVHTVMNAAGLFVSGALDTGDHYSYQFTKPGTYRLACSLHPQMAQTIVVE